MLPSPVSTLTLALNRFSNSVRSTPSLSSITSLAPQEQTRHSERCLRSEESLWRRKTNLSQCLLIEESARAKLQGGQT
jgi:hypothetical protein